MRPFLTLHDPARASDYYARGLWTDDTFYDATQGNGIPNNENLQYLPDFTVGQKAYWKHNVRLRRQIRLRAAFWQI